MTKEECEFYLKTYGHVPWTITIAEALENGMDWDKVHIAKTLRIAQKKIDELTAEKNT